jgi:acyl carrier protein
VSELPAHVDREHWSKVQRAFCDALELDPDEVTWDAKILDDLGAESLDLLDVAFRLERAFDIQIPRGGIEAEAVDVDGEPGTKDGRLTDAGARKLRDLMPEVPEDEIQVGMKASDLPWVFRVATFYNLTRALVDSKARARA